MVTAVNGAYRAGTPTTQIQSLVNGGSGGGGNYTGSSSAYENFTACSIVTTAAENRGNSATSITATNAEIVLEEAMRLVPNPASTIINLSFVPSRTGRVKMEIYSMEGIKVMETNSAVSEAGRQYIQQIDVSKLTSGIYLVRVSSADKSTVKKIIISR